MILLSRGSKVLIQGRFRIHRGSHGSLMLYRERESHKFVDRDKAERGKRRISEVPYSDAKEVSRGSLCSKERDNSP